MAAAAQMRPYYVSAPLVWPLLLGLRVRRVDVDSLLREVGIAAESTPDPAVRIGPEQALALLRAALVVTQDDNLGLHLAQLYEPGVFGTLDHLAHAARTLRGAIEVLLRYERVHQNGMSTTLDVAHGRATIAHRMLHNFPVPRQLSDNTLANLLVIGRRVTGLDFDPLEVHFAHPAPPDVSEHEQFFRCPIYWQASYDHMVIAETLLSAPLLKANPKLAAVLEQHALSLLQRSSDSDFVNAVRDRIYADLSSANASLERVAHAMGQSTRSVQRRLAAEGTSFSALLEGVRERLATEYIGKQRLGSAEVALLLGFSDDRAFRRAFRRWTGKSPSEFRKLVLRRAV